jgi:hypothetical protein
VAACLLKSGGFRHIELSWFAGIEKFPSSGIIAWIQELRIDRIFNEIEKCSIPSEIFMIGLLFGTVIKILTSTS